MTAEDDRLERLTGLARVWGHLYFYHPALSVPDPDWEDLLTAAIPRVEAAATPEAYAAALNDALLRPLDDSWTRAFVVSHESDASDAVTPGGGWPRAEMLPSGIGYLDASDCSGHEQPEYLTHLGEALGELQESAGIILDLRWPHPAGISPWPEAFGLFLREPIRLPGGIERLHIGWSEVPESVYQETRLTRPGRILSPLPLSSRLLSLRYPGTDVGGLPHYDGPLAVLVNDASIGWLDDTLIGLQMAGRAVVLHETAGAIRLPQEPLRLWGGVELHARLYQLAGASGETEVRPDRILPAGNGRESVRAAEELLQRGPSPGPRIVASRFPERPLPTLVPPSMDPLSREQRLLGLIKLWAVLGEFFPHLEFADLDWPNVIHEWTPRVEAAEDAAAYYRLLRDLAARLNDGHVSINHPIIWEMMGTHIPPVAFRRVEGKVVLWNVEDEIGGMGLERGMIVTHVDGRSVEEVIADRGRAVSSSTAGWRDVVVLMGLTAGNEGSPVSLTMEAPDGRRDITLTRSVSRMTARPPQIDGAPVRQVEDFAYIDLTRVASSREFDDALRSFLDRPGLLLDMRGYPRFAVQQQVVSRLIDRPVSSTQFHRPARSLFDRRSWHVSTYEVEPNSDLHFAGPVVVLIDARAISAAEDFCIYLRNAERVTFVGSPTAGTNGNVTFVRLPGGGSLSFTGMRVTYGDGGRFQNIGILPDVPAEPTLAGIRAGRDEVLEAGVATLRRLMESRREA